MHRNLALIALLAIAACGDSPTEIRSGSSWVLASAAGRPLPAVIDSAQFGDYTHVSIMVAGAIAITSADSAIYMRSTEQAAWDAAGNPQTSSAECSSMPVAWRRAGQLVILHRDPIVRPPSQGGGTFPGFTDTLQVSGTRLVRQMRIPTETGTRTVELEYRPGNPPQPPCGVMP